jgi:hypothetical protein
MEKEKKREPLRMRGKRCRGFEVGDEIAATGGTLSWIE